MSTKIKDFAVTLGIIILVALICIYAVSKIDFLSNFFGLSKQEIRVSDTPEFKASVEREKAALESAAYERGRHDQILEDFDKLMNTLPQVNQNFRTSVKTIRTLPAGSELDAEYNQKVKIMEEALK